MKRVLITGGCGFIGSNIAVRFADLGCEVTCFDNLSRLGSRHIRGRVEAAGCVFVRGDVRHSNDLAGLSGRFDLVVDASAEPSVTVGLQGSDARFVVDNNLVGSLNCFEFARDRGSPVIFLSTSRVYPYDVINSCRYRETESRYEFLGPCQGVTERGVSKLMPMTGARSLYGATKLASEIILQEYSAQYGLPAIIDRCGVIAGPWQMGKVDQGVFTHWLVSHYFGRPLAYFGFGGTGKQVRDVLHVEDLVDLIEIQFRQIGQFHGEVFDVGGGAARSLSLLEATALCREITGRELAVGVVAETRAADMIWYVTDASEAESRFGWKPRRTSEQILRDTHKWLIENEASFREVFEPAASRG